MIEYDINSIIRKYIGIPFKDHGSSLDGCDCYGLVSLVYRKEFGLTLPQIGNLYDTAYDRAAINGLIAENTNVPWCITVNDKQYMPFDVMVFRIAGLDYHMGMWVRPGYMLHVTEGAETGIERYDGIKWGKLLHRVLRHKEWKM